MEDYVYKLPRPRIPERAFLKFVGKVSSSMLADLITAYSKGELSYQSDILTAFAGLADIMKNDCGIEVCYGLVSTAISNSLLWRLSTPPAPRRMGFPQLVLVRLVRTGHCATLLGRLVCMDDKVHLDPLVSL
jgi:hypothetical protein